MSKPLIGLIPLYDEKKDSLWMLPGYMEGIEEAGGIPVMLPLTEDDTELEQLCEICDGFLLTGGHDVSPELYGECAVKECGVCCKERDVMEKKLFSMALDQDKALLGICRGIQFMNVVLGGTLYQDLPTQKDSSLEHHQKPPYDMPVHQVRLFREFTIYQLIQKPEIAVNSYHHQAIHILSDRLKVMAYAEDGLAEAVYMPEKSFVWGIQWHPEFSYKTDENSKKILKQFVRAAEEK